MSRHERHEYHEDDDQTPTGADTPVEQDADLLDASDSQLLRTMAREVRQILRRLNKGDITFALLEHRMKAVERLVYGTTGLVLFAFMGALIALVITTHHP